MLFTAGRAAALGAQLRGREGKRHLCETGEGGGGGGGRQERRVHQLGARFNANTFVKDIYYYDLGWAKLIWNNGGAGCVCSKAKSRARVSVGPQLQANRAQRAAQTM